MLKLKFNHILAIIFTVCFAASCSPTDKNDMTRVDRDLPQAELETLCENRNGSACSHLSNRLLERGAMPEKGSLSEDYARKSCDYDYASACASFGFSAELGKTEPKDNLKAATYYSKACRLGNFTGCRSLGYNDHQSHGVLGCTPEAEKFFRPLCKKGDRNACFALGKIVALDEKTPKRDGESIQLYIRGCEGDNAAACYSVAIILTMLELFDNQNPYDTSHYTFKYWDKACSLGYKNSCNEVQKYKHNYSR